MPPFRVIGFFILAVAGLLACWRIARQWRWKRVSGEVTALGPARPSESEPVHPMHSPVLRFLTEKGETIVSGEALGFQFGPALPDEKVVVLYDPESPSHFCNARVSRRFRLEAGLALIGFFFHLLPSA